MGDILLYIGYNLNTLSVKIQSSQAGSRPFEVRSTFESAVTADR